MSTDVDLEVLLARIEAARNFAHDRARCLFAEMDDPGKGAVVRNLAAAGSAYRSIARTLNVILGLDPDAGDDYTERYRSADG